MSVSRVEVSCVKGKCCRPSTSTEFDSTHPAELNGIISQEEFQASIARINNSLKRPKWTYRVQTAGRILIVLGFILVLIAGGKYFHMKYHQRHHEKQHDRHHSNPVAPVEPVTPLPSAPTGVPTEPVQFTLEHPNLPMTQELSEEDEEERNEEEHRELRENDDDDDEEEKEKDEDEDEDDDKNKVEGGEHRRRRHHRRHGHGHEHHERREGEDEKKMAAGAGADGSSHGKGCKKQRKCMKHLFHSGIISLVLGFVLCRWIASRKMHQLVTAVVPAVCAEHHLYTSPSRAVPVSWSLEGRSICRYMCKNNRLKLVLDLHSLVPLSRMEVKQLHNNVAEKQQMISPASYVPLATNEQA